MFNGVCHRAKSEKSLFSTRLKEMFGTIWNFVNHLRDQAHVKRFAATQLIKLKYVHHLNLLEYEFPDKNAVLHI